MDYSVSNEIFSDNSTGSGGSSFAEVKTTFYPRAFTTTSSTHSDSYYMMQNAITIFMIVLMCIMLCFCCVMCNAQNKKQVYYERRYSGSNYNSDSD